jgi:hypothetical protein
VNYSRLLSHLTVATAAIEAQHHSCGVAAQTMFRRCIFLACCACLLAHGQTQFLPEIDTTVKLNSSFRAYVQAKDDRDGGDPTQFTFGPSIQFYRKPLVVLKRVTVFDLDEAKSRPFVLESGYRVITAPDKPVENRAVEAATIHFPFVGKVAASDRNRADLDWQNGSFTWRYRNRFTLERSYSIRSFRFIPYVAAEPFYESQYSKWSSTDLYVGSLFPVGKKVEFDVYYEHENDTGKSPNRQQNYVGLALLLFFSVKNEPPSPSSLQKRSSSADGSSRSRFGSRTLAVVRNAPRSEPLFAQTP